MENHKQKTKEEILEQLYLSADDLLILIPEISYKTAINYIKDTRLKMKDKNLFLPPGKTKLALTKLIRKDCGF